ncbi:pentatricopeptide repeat-containing protein At1g10910, chloroplastic isoform X1 [Tripterygium wilfordii]|nr:pentatricopeptide repeat-containing protein At1g10910, chloroplastic isoform X1 [Tripterygium wilfordii]XP_038683180.1 pentatricopeptide repeat-containing protein At1g10910, chloroplastic isoform X1 [Tripterygium wilfordii]XP_038683181.1 pentatricopeptide repeat-containing protein At1g10910, chloroplastic isoform X1 [Tripterygium wilfordii]
MYVMEISAVCVGFNHHTLTLPAPLSFSLITSLSPPTARAKSPQVSFATTTLVKEPKSVPESPNVAVTPKKRRSYSEKQAAIIQVQQSPDLSSALERLGEILKVQDLNAILRHFGKQSRWQDLSQLFDWMLEHNKINVSSYSSYIKFMGESVNFVKALEIYNTIPDESAKTNVVVCNSVLSCLVKNGKFDSSIKLFHKMKQDGLTPDIFTYSMLLAGCMKVHHGYSRALELVQELEFNGLQMDSVIYGTLLAVCASNDRCEEAESYFSKMKDEGHLPNVFHYSSLLNAYASGGSYKKAEDLVQDMRSSGMVPNKVILTTLLKVYVRGCLFEKSRKLLAELEALGYAQDEMPYCILMDGLAKAGHIDEARSVFREMEEKCVKSDGYCYSIMISAFCRGGLLEEAKHLAKDYQAKYDRYDLVMLNTILHAYCRTGEMENAMQMMKKMDELAISPDCNTFHILIKYFCKEKLYMLAYQTMEDMHSKGHQPAEELCSSLIFHLGKTRAHSEAFSVYNILRYGKRTMCKALHEKILHILIAGRLLKDAYVVVKDNAGSISQPAIKKFANAFVKLGNINLINDVMKVIHCSGYQIGPELFQMAISRYISNPEKKELLLQLLRWMPGQGYAVDSSTRNLILKNSHLFGRQLIAEILSKQQTMSKAMRSHQNKNK